MKVLSPVVWREGMHLAQHHFQLQARYVEDSTSFAADALRVDSYGLVDAKLDGDAISNGTIALVLGRGIMPDGLPFDFSHDAPPPPIDIGNTFSPSRNGQIVALTIPRLRPEAANYADAGEATSAPVRYGVRTEQLVDETSGLDEKRIDLAQKNFSLALDPQGSEDLVVLPLARVIRAGTGAFSYDPMFIPPCLQVGGSERLLAMMRRFVEVLDQRSRSIRAERAQPGNGLAEYASREVMGFWLSHSVQSTLAVMRHLYESRTASPEQVYLELARLAGALCTFSTELRPGSIPHYTHHDLGSTFEELEQFIRRGLDVILPRGANRIPLVPLLEQRALSSEEEQYRSAAPFVYSGSIPDPRAYTNSATWYLGVRCSLAHGEVARRVPSLVKLASEGLALWMATRAQAGLPLEHISAPPGELSPRADTQYFRVSRVEKTWAHILKTKKIGAYVPAALPDVELDLVITSPPDEPS